MMPVDPGKHNPRSGPREDHVGAAPGSRDSARAAGHGRSTRPNGTVSTDLPTCRWNLVRPRFSSVPTTPS